MRESKLGFTPSFMTPFVDNYYFLKMCNEMGFSQDLSQLDDIDAQIFTVINNELVKIANDKSKKDAADAKRKVGSRRGRLR